MASLTPAAERAVSEVWGVAGLARKQAEAQGLLEASDASDPLL
jgi:hypothetical protein